MLYPGSGVNYNNLSSNLPLDIPYFTKFMIFEYTEANNNSPAEYGFSQLHPDGSMNPMWFELFQSNPTPYYPYVAPVV